MKRNLRACHIASYDRDFISRVRNSYGWRDFLSDRFKVFSGRPSLNAEELFEHNSLACRYRVGSNRRE